MKFNLADGMQVDDLEDDTDEEIDVGIEISDRFEYLLMVNMANPAMGSEWLACVFRPKGSDRWRMTYRFRYDAGTDDPFDGADRKSWSSGVFPATKTAGEIVRLVDQVISTLAANGYGHTWRRVIKDRSFESMASELRRAPFAHVTTKEGLKARTTSSKRGQA